MKQFAACGFATVLFLASPVAAGEYQKTVRAQSSLISYYTFDEAAPKDTVAGHHGKIVGGGVAYVAGPKGLGKAICIREGKAVVEFGHVKEFAFADGSGTIEVLLRNSGQNTGGWNFIFAQRNGWAPNSMRYGFCFPNLRAINIVSRGARPSFAKAAVAIEPGKWYHLAVVYDKGKSAAAYLNGRALKLSGAAPLADGAKGRTFHLGGPNPVPDRETWAGSFDELAIYADALPADTIRKHARLAGCDAPIRATATPPKRRLPAPPAGGNHEALRKAIADLMETFGDRYPKGAEFLKRLEAVAKTGDAKAFAALKREALAANPLVSEYPIVFVVRKQYRSHYHAVDMMFSSDEYNWDRRRMHREQFTGGGALKTIDLKTGKVTTLVEVPKGVARDPDVYFDGKAIVFAMRNDKLDDYKIHEIAVNAEGGPAGKPKQLTFAKCVADIDPIYLPDDTIVFASTREPKYNMCSRDIAANLFRMDRDGANIHQITRNTLFDNHASLMPDGRILYARWEYVDRNFGDAHSLWTVNPDGTNQAVYWGNNTAVPGAVFNAHVIPGTDRAVCIFGPHHDRLWGALGIFDRRLGIDGRKPVLRTWPARVLGTFRTGGGFACDTIARERPKYEDPCPLADPQTNAGAGKYFLCSRSIRGEQMGLFAIDIFGNELLLHTEGPGCYDPIPLRPRKRPPIIPSRRDFKGNQGYLLLQDVYVGTHMKGVKRGSVKYLRVVESPPKKHWSGGSWGGQGYEAPGMNFHSFENKRILGAVPVEADGSAYFAVPSETFIYFQALDENGMMVQSMRSGTVVQSGERTGCVGCHEDRLSAPPAAGKAPLAMRRKPSRLTGWYGPPRLFNYAAEVQPVFDKHCVKCHDFDKKAGKRLILAGDRNPFFNASYLDLWSKRIIRCVGGGPAEIRPAYSWGSHASLLTKVVRNRHEKHEKLKLTGEERSRIITWMDINGVYYPDYTCAYPDSCSGRSPLDNKQLGRLRQLTGVNFFGAKSHGGNRGPRISFNRPELSPCLKRFKDRSDPKYAEALAIIRAGAKMLKKRPRVDMPGFVPCEADRKRDKKYAVRLRAEQRSRRAIRTGAKAYDERPAQ